MSLCLEEVFLSSALQPTVARSQFYLHSARFSVTEECAEPGNGSSCCLTSTARATREPSLSRHSLRCVPDYDGSLVRVSRRTRAGYGRYECWLLHGLSVWCR